MNGAASRVRSSRAAVSPLAAAIALAAGTQAYAASIVAVPSNLPAVGGSTNTRAWDVDGDGTSDFTFTFRSPNTTGANGLVWQASMNPSGAVGNALVGYIGAFLSYGTNLWFTQSVGPSLSAGASFRTSAQVTLASVYRDSGAPNGFGGFYPGTPNPGGMSPGMPNGYLGFRIGSGATARYGAIKMTVKSNGITFDYAALGAPGETIQVNGGVPEPTSLAAIALGAVVFLRRPRKPDIRSFGLHRL